MPPSMPWPRPAPRAAFLLLALVLAAAAAIVPAAPARAAIKIVAIGDSNLGAPHVNVEDKYPPQLEAMLRAKGYDVSVANMGINGDTTRGVLGRLDHDVPDGTQIAIVAVGVNDRVIDRVDQDTVGRNLTEIVSRLRARKIEVLLIGVGPMADPGCCFGQQIADASGALYYRNFQDAVFYDHTLHAETEMPGQGVGLLGNAGTAWHLNKTGYGIVVQRTLPLVERLIARVQGTAPPADPRPIPIVAVGDSTVLGFGTSFKGGSGGVPVEQSFPADIERLLRARGWNATVANAGVNADTSAKTLARIDAAVPAGTELTIVGVGGKDALEKIPPQETLANIKAIGKTVNEKGSLEMFLSERPPTQPYLVGWAVGLRDSASHYPAPEYDSGDHEHLNAAGNELIAERAIPDIERALKTRGFFPAE